MRLARRLVEDRVAVVGFALQIARHAGGAVTELDHRDPILGEVARQTHMLICCSRARSDVLVLDL